MTTVGWDPVQYTKYADERSRPLADLVAQIHVDDPALVVDLGCGPGPMTRLLAARWPSARVIGVDSSPDMVDAASTHAEPGRVEFEVGDAFGYEPPRPADVIVANAVFQWVPGHLDRLPDLAARLAPGGALAFQVPDNFTEPSHVILAELRRSPRWRDRLGEGADRAQGVERPETYLSALSRAGLATQVWQTTYLHVLTGQRPVVEWMSGTALRPVFARLAGDDSSRERFLAELGERLAEAYPPSEVGTVFPFRRTFAVGHAPG